jgi:hypothetical protein
MTPIAATVALFVAVMVGYYWARWRRAEASLRTAKGRADAAGKAAWRSRGLIILLAATVDVVLHAWFGGRGR